MEAVERAHCDGHTVFRKVGDQNLASLLLCAFYESTRGAPHVDIQPFLGALARPRRLLVLAARRVNHMYLAVAKRCRYSGSRLSEQATSNAQPATSASMTKRVLDESCLEAKKPHLCTNSREGHCQGETHHRTCGRWLRYCPNRKDLYA